MLIQGTIFPCAVADDYAGCETHGLVITARCDAAHDKARIFSYLPVVKLEDWLLRDFSIIACQRATKDIDSSLRNQLTQHALSPTILTTQTPREILDTLFPATHPDKRRAKARPQFETQVRRAELVLRVSSGHPTRALLEELNGAYRKANGSLLVECLQQRLAGYYFLPTIECSTAAGNAGYVVLLREVRHLPRVLAESIASGLDLEGYERLCANDKNCIGKLRIGPNDFTMPLGVLRSPEIEHLMQEFSLLFGRIGVDDLDPTYVRSLAQSHIRPEDTE